MLTGGKEQVSKRDDFGVGVERCDFCQSKGGKACKLEVTTGGRCQMQVCRLSCKHFKARFSRGVPGCSSP